jgi:hypothetical protein
MFHRKLINQEISQDKTMKNQDTTNGATNFKEEEIKELSKLIREFSGGIGIETLIYLANIENHQAWKFIDLTILDETFNEAEKEGLRQSMLIEEGMNTFKGKNNQRYEKFVALSFNPTTERLALLGKLDEVLRLTMLFEFVSVTFKMVDNHFQKVSLLKYEESTTKIRLNDSKDEFWNSEISELQSKLTKKISWVNIGNKSLSFLSDQSNFKALISQLGLHAEESKAESAKVELERIRKYHLPTIEEVLGIRPILRRVRSLRLLGLGKFVHI